MISGFAEGISIWIRGNYVEFIAALISIVGVWLTTKQIIWCWPVSLAGLILSLFVFFYIHLYLQSILQIFYIVIALFGWYYWLYGGKVQKEIKVSRLKKEDAWIYIVSAIFAAIIFGYLFKRYTEDPLPWLDAATSVCGIITTYLMAKKIIENWLIWIANDVVVVWMCYYQKLYIFTILYLVFIILAVYGWKEWRKELKTK